MSATTILVLIAALISVNAQPIAIAQNNNQNFVPGVFISADALKDLQQKAQQNQNPPITNQGVQPIINTGRNAPGVSPSSQSDAYQPSSSPQSTAQNQPSTVLASQPVMAQSTVSSQPTVLTSAQPQVVVAPSQPQVVVAQPVLSNQPSNQMYQPNQAYVVQQPGNNQPIYLSQPATGTQYVSQPNQQIVLSNGQVAQVVSNAQPNGQIYVSNGQPFVNNGQPFVNNGQPFVNSGQPLLVSTNPGTNQITLIQGARQNPVPNTNTGVQYAVVPVGQNNVAPNTNANGNTYLMVPSSSSNQVYAVSG